MRKHWQKLLLFPFVFLAVFANLGGPHLWEDEANTALLGFNIVQFGLPMAFDGKNLVTDRADGKDSNKNGVWTWNTWLPYYMTAGSFLIGEKDQFWARLPFAIAGFLCFIAIPYVYRELTDSGYINFLPAFLLLFSIPFLLHIRQCRYYSLGALFSLLSAWGYLRTINGKRYGPAFFTISNIFLFHSFYALMFVNLAGLGLHYLLFGRGRCGISFQTIFTCLSAIALFTLPFALYAGYLPGGLSREINLFNIFVFFKIYALWINFFVCPFFLMTVLSFFLCSRKNGVTLLILTLLLGLSIHLEKSIPGIILFPIVALPMAAYHLRACQKNPGLSSHGADWWTLPTVYTLVSLIIFSAASPFPFFRYIVHLIPLAVLLMAYLVGRLWKKNKGATILFITLWICSNLFSLLPAMVFNPFFPGEKSENREVTLIPYQSYFWLKPRFDLFAYIHEIMSPANDLNGLITRYINKHAEPGDIVKASYGEFPLMFHTPLRVYNRFERGDKPPDWVILREGYPFIKDGDYVKGLFENYRFQMIGFRHKNIPWNDNRPDPLFHYFSPPVTSEENLVIFNTDFHEH